MTKTVDDTGRDAAVQAIEANMSAYWLTLGSGPRGEVYNGSELQWVYTGSPVLNRVMGARLDGTTVGARIEQVVARFRAWNAGVAWLLGPSTRPADLGARLTAQGFIHEGDWVGMAHDLRRLGVGETNGAADAPGLVVREVTDRKGFDSWLRIVGAGFALPRPARLVFRECFTRSGFGGHAPWRHFVGLVDGRPLSAATLFTAEGAAGVYLVATVPHARGRGFATALTRRVLAEARAHGHDLAVLQATQAGKNLYRTLGFEERCTIDIYRWTPADGSGLGRRWAARLRRLWRNRGWRRDA
ncbi:MAG: GNAT family N-acetyltransferase [Chloroflexi bacterium]|nr:GNAT family N-acetyltransferase [Chloroflexota bacterium]